MQNTPAGTIITSAQSVSQNGKHVFQVPMFDPDKIPSGSAGFPWKADGDFRTVLYIQNVSDVERRFTAHLVFEGGQYSIGDRTIKPQETIAVDFREFRDEQTADKLGRLIPLGVDHGQIAWSVRAGGSGSLSVRSEQISLSEGVASTYVCYNGCCANRVIDGWIDPVTFQDQVGGSLFMSGTQIEENCYLEQFYSPIAFITWSSENTDVATIDTGGFAEAVGAGETTIFAFWQREWYHYGLGTVCELEHFPRNDEVPVALTLVEINGPTQADDGSSVLFSATVGGATPTGYQWSFTTPSGSGNNPDLNFGSPTSVSTIATAKWFALPNQECPPDPNNTTAYRNSTYTVKLEVTFSNRGPITKEKSFTVQLPEDAGTTTGSVDTEGEVTKGINLLGEYYVAAQNTYRIKRLPPVVNYLVLPTSQFRSKIETHEQIHVSHWEPQGMFGLFFTDAGLYNAVKNETAFTANQLDQKILLKFNEYRSTQISSIKSSGTCNQSEIAAFTVSDSLTPQFMYQRCGRSVFPTCQ